MIQFNNYKVYMHKCKNNKVYIGITIKDPKIRWKNGKGYMNNDHFYKAIQKYGWDNIEHIVLFENLTKEEAEQKEIELIAKYNSTNREFGYNRENGGMHRGKTTYEIRKKISEGNKGKKHTEEARKKMSIAKKGKKKKPFSDIHREHLRLAHIGKHHSKEHLIKMSKAVRCIETGEIFDATAEAERKTNIAHANIINNCNGKRKSAGKLHWEWVN